MSCQDVLEEDYEQLAALGWTDTFQRLVKTQELMALLVADQAGAAATQASVRLCEIQPL